MSEPQGMLSVEDLTRLVAAGEIDTVVVAFTDVYGRLVGKRFDAGFFLDSAVKDGTHACNYLLTVDMEMEPIEGYGLANWEDGYGDFHLHPDMSSLRRASWLEKTAVVLCDVEREGAGAVAEAPRSLLRRQVERATEMGFTAKAASELEFYIYQDTFRDAAKKGYRDLSPAGYYIEDYHVLQTSREEPFIGAVRRHLRDSGVPVENSKGEWGHGQHEINVRYTDALSMADRHVIYKQCVKEVADQMEQSVTFMAKPWTEQAGSSCHIHLSLWSEDSNAFAGDTDYEGIACTDQFRWFLGGWMKRAPEVMAMYASTVNAYKRYQSASWAPTTLAWSYDNRTAGFRIVGEGSSLRIECRIPGADCNPYLAFAAALASGLDGIKNQTEPPAMLRGDAYKATAGKLPTRMGDAIESFRSSDFAREAFGAEVVDHYVHHMESERAAYERAVTDWERDRYFEQI